MKRIICALIVAVMLVTMIPVSAISVSAEDAELSGHLNVTHYKDNDAKVSGTTTSLDWSKLWDSKNTSVRFGIGLDIKPEIIGKFDKPTEVTDVVFTFYKYHGALNNITVSFSNTPDDADSWVLLKTVVGVGGVNNTNMQQIEAIDCQGVKYEYVKISATDAAYQAQYNNYNIDLYSVSFYNITDDMETLDNVQHVWQPFDVSVDASVLWDYSNDTLIEWNVGSSNYNTVTGEFKTPTKVDFVVIKTPADKVANYNWSSIELSTNGSSYEAFQVDYADRAGDNLVFAIPRDTAYTHIRFKINANTNFSLKSIGVVGTPQAPESNESDVRLNVTHYSDNGAKFSANNGAIPDWSRLWDTKNLTFRFGNGLDRKPEIIGKFDEPTIVTNAVIVVHSLYSETNGITISLSNTPDDADSWVQVDVVTGATTENSGSNLGLMRNSRAIDCQGVKYEYVKVSCLDSNYQEAYNNYRFDALSISFYNITDDMAVLDDISHVRQSMDASVDASVLWDYSNDTEIEFANNGEIVMGEFSAPTKVDFVVLETSKNTGNTFNWSFVELSTDGYTWDRYQILDPAKSDENIVCVITRNTKYKFIRYNHAVAGEGVSLKSIGVVGTPQAPVANETEADFYGVQTKVDTAAGNWSIRFISTVDSLNFKSVGYEIKATGVDKDGTPVDKSWDLETQTVYGAVYDDMGRRSATALGGNHIFTATVHSISLDKYGELTFEIKPYVVNSLGQKLYGKTQTYTLNDGVVQ